MVFQHFIQHPFRITAGCLKIVCAWHLFVNHVFAVSSCAGPSMLPTFSVTGDWLAINFRKARNRHNDLRVGDLVMYTSPIFAEGRAVKRLVGMPGDYVSLGTPGEKGEELMIQVPQGHCWVVGDNLPASRDSRRFGPLPIALIRGKIIGRVLPWSERKRIVNELHPVDNEP
jgi:inner membrane protease subunit 1